MKRLVIITVGKTHSGKTTFAKALEKELENSFVMDQDYNAEFINTFYKKLQPTEGPNTLKHSISKLIIEYAKEQTNLHFIISNSNRSRKDRSYLLDDLFNKKEFIRIIVHFDIPDEVLYERVSNSQRSTSIFRGPYTNFKEILIRQLTESIKEEVPTESEADYLLVIKDNEDINSVIKKIVFISQTL